MIPLLSPSARLRVRKKSALIMVQKAMCASFITIVLLAQSVNTQESDKLDLETYNAQLLDNLDQSQISDNLSNSEFNDEVIGQSVVSSTSSAISYAELQEEISTQSPRPRSDRTSQTSWSLNEDVPLNDPELGAVFPTFAEAYNQEEAQQLADLSDLEFVDEADFAVLNEDGSIESFGKAEELEQAVYYDQYDNYDSYDDQGAEVFDDYYNAPPEPASNEGFVNLGQNSGPTTLMLFNIFSPDEVDFLETLVGEDALKELKDDVDVQPDAKEEQIRQTLEFSKPQSRRPPTSFVDEPPKNAYPSSQGIVHPDSSIRESLEVYHKSGFQYADAGDLVEEGVEQAQMHENVFVRPQHFEEEQSESLVSYSPINRENDHHLKVKADERRVKMEALLEKLSERYEKRKESTVNTKEDALDEEIQETEEQTNRMKNMIDNLKHRLSQSRVGVNTIDIKTLDDEPVHRENTGKIPKLFHTTPKPIGIDKVSEMIGEKIREMSVGMNRLDLDEILDLDGINVKAKGESSDQLPTPQPPGYDGSEEDNVNKRQIVHPKLKRKRPLPQGAHLPSINLKAIITPATDAPNLAALEYKERPIIPRYVDDYSPPEPYVPPPQPYTYPAYGSSVQVKELPKRMGPRLQGYKPKKDENSDVKSLPPIAPVYDKPVPPPSAKLHHEPQEHQFLEKTTTDHYEEKQDSLPPTLFYSDRHVPSNFDPKTGPQHFKEEPHALPLEQVFEDKYIPSDSYRKPITPLEDPVDEQKRTSKEYAPATFTQFPPPSYEYKQPNIRFDETPTKAPYIQVTPKNTPKTTTLTSHLASIYSTTTPHPTPHPTSHIHSLKPKQLPPRPYTPTPAPYKPPSYGSHAPPDPKYKFVTNPKAEHVSSLEPPTRGYVPPVGPGTTAAPPPRPYHSPRPGYLSPPRASSGYVPPSSGNYISRLSPPSHGYSTPAPHVKSITPPKKAYLPPQPPPKSHYPTAKPSYVSTIKPPSKGYSTPKYISTIAPPSRQYSKPVDAAHHLAHAKVPHKSYHSGLESYMTTMKPPKNHYNHGVHHHLSTMAPPSHDYKKEVNAHISTIKPPVHYYEKPMYEKLTKMNLPKDSYETGLLKHLSGYAPPPEDKYHHHSEGGHGHEMTEMKAPHINYQVAEPPSNYAPPPKDKYLPPDPKMLHLTPPLGEYTGIQPNYMQKLNPPKSNYDEGMKSSIMAKLSPPEQEYLEHAMSIKSYLPPDKNYKTPPKLTKDHPPTHDYMDFVAQLFQDMKAPSKGYKSPHSTKMKPPTSEYEEPITDYLATFHLPRKGYLPPDNDDKHMKPPSTSYEDPIMDYMTSMKAPDKGYIPPKPKMKPPTSSYEKPVTDYLATMHAPDQGYLPPKPSTDFLPELASYLSPIQEYMASLLPPAKGNSYEPPSTDYLTPLKDHEVETIHPPIREYLAPFKDEMAHFGPPSSEYGAPQPTPNKQPKLLPVVPPKPVPVLGVCPPIRKDVKCEYVQNTCWSVGVPDVDCPGNGLCCFDGCANHCLRSPTLIPKALPFHIPPNKAYLVPSHEYLFLEQALASRRRNGDAEGVSISPSSQIMYSLAALEHLDELKSLPDLPTVNQLPRKKPDMLVPPTKYKPPAKNYLVPEPKKKYVPPVDGYELPSYSGKEPSYDPKRPSLKDLPPIANYKVAAHLQEELPPGQEYLPPPKISKYTPPSEGYQLPKELNQFVPPNEYLPPPEKMVKYHPPSEEYKVPKYMQEMGPPTKQYSPPGKVTHLHPPSSGYSAPEEMINYKPPSKDYIVPPPEAVVPHHHSTTTFRPVHFSRGALDSVFKTPDKEYVPPASSYTEKVPMIPPSEGYAVPHEARFHPPSKEYLPPVVTPRPPHPSELPPEVNLDHHVPMVPPREDYVSPKSPKKITVNGVHYQLPTKEYLPPYQEKDYHSDKEHGILTPPIEEYLPPEASVHGEYHPPPGQANLKPPVKEYLPPNYYTDPHHGEVSHDLGATYHPPTEEYYAPTTEYHPVPHPKPSHHAAPGGVAFAPPSKEYLPPIDYKVKDLGPEHPTLVPPSKEYLPPPSNPIETIGHAIHVKEHHQHHVTVPPTFLPPHHPTHSTPHHHKDEVAPTFLPPHDNPKVPLGGIAPTFLPPHDKSPKGDYHVTATLDKDHVPISVTHDGPHSMNIQINLSGLKDHLKEGDKYPDIPPLYRTSKPPAQIKDHPHADHEAVHPSMLPPHYEAHPHDIVMPHMLPHTGHYKEDAKSHHGPSHHGPPPSLPQYVPPPLSTHADTYAYKPHHDLPPREYVPVGHSLHPKQYLPTNPLAYQAGRSNYPSYDLKSPAALNLKDVDPMRTFKPPVADFRPPSEINAPIRADGYIPPAEPTSAYSPPDKDYLPPVEPVTDDPEIPVPPLPEELPPDVDIDIDDGLASRGPQTPLNLKDKPYVPPPPRPGGPLADVEDVLNSQIGPPATKLKDPYIPKKTKFDVPKNFVRPEDAEIDPKDEVDDFGTIDILDAEGLPEPPVPDFVPNSVGEAEDLTEQPFLGLAKLQSASLQDKSLKELEELRDEVKKLAKLIEKPESNGPQLPPMPTLPTLSGAALGSLKLPPQPSSFMPFLEKLQPSVLQQLQANIRSTSNQQGGKIPGKPGVDYPDFKTIPATDFSCENFILEGFYADTFTSCQVFHVCESGKRQSSFLCPRGTIFNQKHRVCDWWYNVKCEDSTEFYDLNLDLLLLEKGVSPSQATNLNVPPPIDPLSSFGSLPLDLLGGSDAELDSLILDDLVLSNLLGNRRMDTGASDMDQLLGATSSPISNMLPSAIAAPVQPQPPSRRPRRRKKKKNKNKSAGRDSGFGSLCQIMNICDSVPAPSQSKLSDLVPAPSEFQPSILPAPKELRMNEKTAAEIAALYADDRALENLPQRFEEMEDSVPAASSYSNSLSIPQVSISLPLSSMDYESSEINFEEGEDVYADIPETYRQTHFGQDVTQLKNHSNVPITYLNFEDYLDEDRKSKMMPDSEEEIEKDEKEGKVAPEITTESDFKLADHNVDRESRTWTPMRVTDEGEIERSEVSKPLDESDWIPKLGPDIQIRET